MVTYLYFHFIIFFIFFFFNDTATTEIYTLSLHDALPISSARWTAAGWPGSGWPPMRSEEHTSELQSRENLVCRLLLEKKKKIRHMSVFIKIITLLIQKGNTTL